MWAWGSRVSAPPPLLPLPMAPSPPSTLHLAASCSLLSSAPSSQVSCLLSACPWHLRATVQPDPSHQDPILVTTVQSRITWTGETDGAVTVGWEGGPRGAPQAREHHSLGVQRTAGSRLANWPMTLLCESPGMQSSSLCLIASRDRELTFSRGGPSLLGKSPTFSKIWLQPSQVGGPQSSQTNKCLCEASF